MMTSKTVLLTGISGFIAKRIALDLLNRGYSVVGSLRSLHRADEVKSALKDKLTDPTNIEKQLRFVKLDLNSDDGWNDAMSGIDSLIHTASPFPIAQPKNEDELVRPAVQGTLRALRSAQRAGVTRVVLTSSIVAIMNKEKPEGAPLTEEDWTDLSYPTVNAYDKSKTLAEKAAWDFVEKHPEMKLTTINPGLVAGTPMDEHYGSSLSVIERFWVGKDPFVPNIGLPLVDISDVSEMHITALEKPEAVNQRYIAADRFVMFPELARILAKAYPSQKIPTKIAPKFLLRLIALFDSEVKSALPRLNIEMTTSSAKASRDLGIQFTSAKESILASAAFIAEAKN